MCYLWKISKIKKELFLQLFCGSSLINFYLDQNVEHEHKVIINSKLFCFVWLALWKLGNNIGKSKYSPNTFWSPMFNFAFMRRWALLCITSYKRILIIKDQIMNIECFRRTAWSSTNANFFTVSTYAWNCFLDTN